MSFSKVIVRQILWRLSFTSLASKVGLYLGSPILDQLILLWVNQREWPFSYGSFSRMLYMNLLNVYAMVEFWVAARDRISLTGTRDIVDLVKPRFISPLLFLAVFLFGTKLRH